MQQTTKKLTARKIREAIKYGQPLDSLIAEYGFQSEEQLFCELPRLFHSKSCVSDVTRELRKSVPKHHQSNPFPLLHLMLQKQM